MIKFFKDIYNKIMHWFIKEFYAIEMTPRGEYFYKYLTKIVNGEWTEADFNQYYEDVLERLEITEFNKTDLSRNNLDKEFRLLCDIVSFYYAVPIECCVSVEYEKNIVTISKEISRYNIGERINRNRPVVLSCWHMF